MADSAASRDVRSACLVAARFPVAALLRAEPELRGCPLAVCDSRRAGGKGRAIAGPRDPVIGVSREGERLGLRSGMTVAQALVRHADTIVRPVDRVAMQAGRAALLELASSISPRVETVGEGIVAMDITGLERAMGTPAGIAAALLHRAERIGFEVGVGIADGPSTARIAAHAAARDGEVIVVASGGDAGWLAPLPLTALASVVEGPVGRWESPTAGAAARRRERPSWEEVAEGLRRVGLTRIGDLARLSLAEVTTRFGRVGGRAWRIAAGQDPTTIQPAPSPPDLSEGVDLEYGIDSLEALLFVLRGLLDRLAARLQVLSLACRRLEIHLDLESGATVQLDVGVLSPTRDVKTLTLLSRSALEKQPPRTSVQAVRILAIPDRARPAQLDLFRAAGPPPERLATTLARLDALCGTGRVGRPVPPSGHRPDEMSVAPFAPSEGSVEPPRPTAVREDLLPALRAIRPPIPADVYLECGRIAYVRAPGLAGRAVVSSGPWRIETEWWNDSPCRRDYYDIQLSDGGVYRLYRDLGRAPAEALAPGSAPTGGRWFVDGSYD